MKINRLFDYADFSNQEFIEAQEEFHEKGGTSRKSWEFVIMSQGLKQLGCFDGKGVALGTGCLKENLIYLYANRFGHVYATDVAYYDTNLLNVKPWGGEKYSLSEVYDGKDIPFDKTKLTVLPMDMMVLEFPDASMDAIWSSSSVEHCGGVGELLKCFTEAERVLKPNGVFSITTEWNLSGGGQVRFANVQTVDPSVMTLIEKVAPKLQLVEPLSLERSDHVKNLEKEYMLGKTNRFYGNACDYTSVSLFWRKQ